MISTLIFRDSILENYCIRTAFWVKWTLHATARGNEFDFKKMQTVAHFQIPAAMVKGYNYRNLSMDISMQNGIYHINSIFNDQNLKWHLDAKGKWIEKISISHAGSENGYH